MKIILILVGIILATVFFLVLIRKKKRAQLKEILAVAETKKAEIYAFIGTNYRKLYSPENALKIEDCKKAVDECRAILKEIDVDFNKEKISKEADRVIGEAKKEAGFFIDPFGLQVESARMALKMKVSIEGMKMKLDLLLILLNLNPYYFSLLFTGISPEYKEDKVLIEKCEDLLKQEFVAFTMARKFLLMGEVDRELLIVNPICNSIKSDYISLFIKEFKPFLQVV